MSGALDPVARWRDDLAAWAIPERILARAPAPPWTPERSVFIRRAAERQRTPGGRSYELARNALPEGGSVLDVGAGAGAASLPLLGRARTLIAVDQDAALLDELLRAAAGRAVEAIVGSWPDVEGRVPAADVVVCHHVLYNVPELRPFIEALDRHARHRAVIEITSRHPVARLNPLWQRFHGLVRPTRPTWEDALAAIRSVRAGVRVEREPQRPAGPGGTWTELVAASTRRLCLPPARQADVAAALIAGGSRPDEPATWPGAEGEIVTFWWDGPGRS